MVGIEAPTTQALTDSAWLCDVLGPVDSIESLPLRTVGYSGSTHQRLQVRLASGAVRGLVVKRVLLSRDWTVYRTGDTRGREAALLGEPSLQGIWEVFACPYLAYAVQDGEIGLLMEDLTDSLLPDVDVPLLEAEEDRVLSALATMHARHWNASSLDIGWLTSPQHLLEVLGPFSGEEESARGASHPLFESVARGWRMAFDVAPSAIGDTLRRPAEAWSREWLGLPRTLIHGDAKVANFAFLADGGIAAFDWAWVGAGPCSLDLGWYLAVNSERLAGPKEEVIERYRGFLEACLDHEVPNALWDDLLHAGILCAARMLLWAQALLQGLGP